MSTPAVQLSFTLRTATDVSSVHLLGSWDGYSKQLPLSISKEVSAKPGSWKGTFRFQGAHALKLGSRYWYYYIIDGYKITYDPYKENVVEKTTGRNLNILNVPAAEPKRPAPLNLKSESRVRTAQAPMPKTPATAKLQIAIGTCLTPTKIQHPRPQKPYASQSLREADYETSPIEDLGDRFSSVHLNDNRNYLSSPSDLSDLSDGTVFSSASDNASSCTSSGSEEEASCRCNRYGVTRDGRRVMLDCGGKRCGYAESDSSSSCDDSSCSEEESTQAQQELQRAAELRKRARARLIAERARNGITTTAPASQKVNVLIGLPATPRMPRAPQSSRPTRK